MLEDGEVDLYKIDFDSNHFKIDGIEVKPFYMTQQEIRNEEEKEKEKEGSGKWMMITLVLTCGYIFILVLF